MDRSELASLQLESGTYKLRFATGEYWQQQGLTSFYPYVEVSFRFSCTRASDSGRPVALGPLGFCSQEGPPAKPKRSSNSSPLLLAGGLHPHSGRTKGAHPAAAQPLFLRDLPGELVRGPRLPSGGLL